MSISQSEVRAQRLKPVETHPSVVTGADDFVEDSTRLREPPEILPSMNDVERALWDTFVQTKAYDDWTEADLIMLYQVIFIHKVLAAGKARIDFMMSDGADVLSPDTYANMYMMEYNRQQAKLIALYRCLGMSHNSARGSGTAMANLERQQRDAFEAIRNGYGGVPDFMATGT